MKCWIVSLYFNDNAIEICLSNIGCREGVLFRHILLLCIYSVVLIEIDGFGRHILVPFDAL
jgi:hypothetical protein